MKVNFVLSVGAEKDLEGIFDSEKVIRLLEAYEPMVADIKGICGFIMVTIKRGEYIESCYTEHFLGGKQVCRACENICNILSVIQ